MSGDTLVFDMASESEGVPSVFVRKDWLSILDNQNGSYQGNQSVIDTSQLANSNKYINYREAYLTVPMLMVLTAPVNATAANAPLFATRPMDQSVGLKNWYGSIVHSFTLDYNGTTIIQQTPYIGLWNTFKLMTSLSWNDVATMGSQIGFYPDTSESVGKVAYNQNAISKSAVLGATYNNQLATGAPFVMSNTNTSESIYSDTPTNLGLQKRQKMWNFNPEQIAGSVSGETNVSQAGTFYLGGAVPANSGSQNPGTIGGLTNLWKSYLFSRVDTTALVQGQLCWAITAQIYLKHLHSFFERVPLLKGVFCKMTLNLNQTSVTLVADGGTGTTTGIGGFASCQVQSPLGGVSPLMVMSGASVALAQNTQPVSQTLDTSIVVNAGMGTQLLGFDTTYTLSLQVGNACLNTTQTGGTGAQGMGSPLGRSILLNAPAYSFSPVFEASYLADPVKKIVYTDVYQYQIVNQIASGGVFNNLITNGIANIKSVLVLPFYSAGTAGVVAGASPTGNGGLLPIQSPFEGAGGGSTSPYISLNQFNIQISGQNAIYNTERYAYEQWLNQTYGVNAVNGGMTDGLSSGLVSQKDFETCYSYYYVNCGRMLPVEEAVPKSVNIIGQNQSAYAIDLFIFVEYGVEIDIDILTGARV